MNIATQAQSYFNDWMSEKTAPKWLEKLLTKQLPLAVALLLVLLISWRAAELTWSLIPVSEVQQQRQKQGANAMPTAQRQGNANQLDNVAKLHLFGIAGATKTVKKIDTKAPETRLNLTLHGVFVADQAEKGEALIGTSGNVQKYYKVGNAVMSGVTLQAVFEDRVVLLRNGRSEVLRFPKVSKSRPVTNSRVSTNAQRSSSKSGFGPGASTGNKSKNLSKYRDLLRKEPLKIFEYVRFVPVKSREGMKGYRILPQKNRELYNQLGVRPSDLVTSVNGVALSNDQEAMKLIEKLKGVSSVQVEIVRNGKPQTLNFDFN
ncbi:MAG: type II secretion system protein GspC [gamma proteobacterium symbiont of Ctena orbiculata]|nr:MAG: type II secretion system protein GspC [gamma proteobacterium symbiont of Ctena orbiculata]